MIHPQKLTVGTWKWMVGIRYFPFGAPPMFRCYDRFRKGNCIALRRFCGTYHLLAEAVKSTLLGLNDLFWISGTFLLFPKPRIPNATTTTIKTTFSRTGRGCILIMVQLILVILDVIINNTWDPCYIYVKWIYDVRCGVARVLDITVFDETSKLTIKPGMFKHRLIHLLSPFFVVHTDQPWA